MKTRTHGWSQCWKAALVMGSLLPACGGDSPMPPMISVDGADGSLDASSTQPSHQHQTPDAGARHDGGSVSVDASDSLDSGGAEVPGAAEDDGGDDASRVIISQNIAQDTTWTSDHTYVLTGAVFVDGATLTIEPGTVIKGTPYGGLVVTTRGKLDAQGTADKPIVFTSFSDEGHRARGDWRGIVLLGMAATNKGVGQPVWDDVDVGTTAFFQYGGNDDTHGCGKLRYVRIEWAGARFGKVAIPAALSLGGCGSSTEVEYVQVHGASADAIDIFGGVVSLKHVVASASGDALHWGLGWRGKLQFLAGKLAVATAKYGIFGSSHSTSEGATFESSATVYNATLLGSKLSATGMGFANGDGEVKNVLVEGFGNSINLSSNTGAEAFDTDKMVVANSLFFDIGIGLDASDFFKAETNPVFDPVNTSVFLGYGDDLGWIEADHFTQPKYANVFGEDPGLTNPYALQQPTWVPPADSPARNNPATPPSDGFFDSSASYIGAFAPGGEDWTAGWTVYPVK